MYIELLLANSVVALFFIFLAIFVEKHGYIKQQSSGFKAFRVVTYLAILALIVGNFKIQKKKAKKPSSCN